MTLSRQLRPARYAGLRRSVATAAAFLAIALATILPSASTRANEDRSLTALNARVEALSHSITFGRQIEVALVAESPDEDIVAVRAEYRPRGPRTVSAYTYPSFSPGRKIQASFSIETSGSSYYPPGTEFDISYLLTGSSGATFESALYAVEYLDPKYQWKRLVRDPLTVIYTGFSEPEARRFLDAATARLPYLMELTGAGSGAPLRAVLYRNLSDATPAFPLVSETATDRQFFAGFAESRFGLFVLGAPSQQTFIHELTHLLTGQAVGSPLAGNLPAWLNEGISVWAEGEGLAALNSRITSAARRNSLLKIRSMGSVPGRREDIALFYPQAGAFVGYLEQRFGAEGIAALLAEVNAGRNAYDSAKSVWSVSFEIIENEWRHSIGALPLPAALPTSAGATVSPLATRSPTTIESPAASASPGQPDVPTRPPDAVTVPSPTEPALPTPAAAPASGAGTQPWIIYVIVAVAGVSAGALIAFSRRRVRR